MLIPYKPNTIDWNTSLWTAKWNYMYSKYLEHLYAYMRRLFNTKNDTKIPTHGKKNPIFILSEHLVDIYFDQICIETSLR